MKPLAFPSPWSLRSSIWHLRTLLVIFLAIIFPLEMNATPPENDLFEKAQALDGERIRVAFDGADSTVEASEPIPLTYPDRGSLWFSWVSPSTHRFNLSLSGTGGFERAIRVYTGTKLTDLIARSTFGPSTTLSATAGTRYLFQASLALSGEINPVTRAMTLQLRPKPAHDDFSDALPLSGDSWTTPFETADTINEPEENSMGHRLGAGWIRWTAPKTGGYAIYSGKTFLVQGESSTPIGTVQVYQGSQLAQLIELDPIAGGRRSDSLWFRAIAGESYSIAVSDLRGRRQEIGLQPLAPSDELSGATAWPFPLDTVGTLENQVATLAAEEGPWFPSSNVADYGAGTTWFTFTALTAGRYFWESVTPIRIGSNQSANLWTPHDRPSPVELPWRFGSVVALEAGEKVVWSAMISRESKDIMARIRRFDLANDQFAKAQLLPTVPEPIEISMISSTIEELEPPHRVNDQTNPSPFDTSIWYRWVAAKSGGVLVNCTHAYAEIFTGDSLPNLARENYAISLPGPLPDLSTPYETRFHSTAGMSYYIRIASLGVPKENVRMTWDFAPDHDDITTAKEILRPEYSDSFQAYAGSAEGLETSARHWTVSLTGRPRTFWYRWKATQTGLMTWEGSGIPTVLTRPDVSANTNHFQIVDTRVPNRIRGIFPATIGETYYLGLAVINDSFSADVALSQWIIAGDSLRNPIVISTTNGGWGRDVSYSLSTYEIGEPWFFPDPLSQGSVWLQWVAPRNGGARIRTPLADTRVYRGSAITGLTPVDELSSPRPDLIHYFRALAGETYSIVLRGESPPSASSVRVDFVTAPINDDVDQAIEISPSGGTIAVSLQATTREPREFKENLCCVYPHTVWYQWKPQVSGVYQFVQNQGKLSILMELFSSGQRVLGTSDFFSINDTFVVNGGQEYQIRFSSSSEDAWATVTLSRPLPQKGDSIANPIPIRSRSPSPAFLGHSTREVDEANWGNLNALQTTWWRWIGEGTGPFLLTVPKEIGIAYLAIIKGTNMDPRNIVASATFSTNSSPRDSSRFDLTFRAERNTEYRFLLATSIIRDFGTLWSLDLFPPSSNDSFDRAYPIDSKAGYSSNQRLYSYEPGEQSPGQDRFDGSAWYRLPSIRDREYHLQITETNGLASVGIGTSVDTIQWLKSIPLEGFPVELVVSNVPGARHYLVIESSNSISESVTRRIQLLQSVTNDFFTGALLIPKLENSSPFPLLHSHLLPLIPGWASKQPDEPTIGGSGKIAWFQIRNLTPGSYLLSLDSQTAPFHAQIFQGTTLSELQPIGIQFTNGVEWTLDSQGDVYVGLDDYDLRATPLDVPFASNRYLTVLPLEPHDSFAKPQIVPSISYIFHRFAPLTREPGEPIHGTNATGGSYWAKWTAGRSGLTAIDVATEDSETIPPAVFVYQGESFDSLQAVPTKMIKRQDSKSTWAVIWTVQQGQTFRFAFVDADRHGFLGYSVRTPILEDHFDSRPTYQLTLPSPLYLNYDSTLAEVALNEPIIDRTRDSRTIWFDLSAPIEGIYSLRLAPNKTSVSHRLILFEGTNIQSAPVARAFALGNSTNAIEFPVRILKDQKYTLYFGSTEEAPFSGTLYYRYFNRLENGQDPASPIALDTSNPKALISTYPATSTLTNFPGTRWLTWTCDLNGGIGVTVVKTNAQRLFLEVFPASLTEPISPVAIGQGKNQINLTFPGIKGSTYRLKFTDADNFPGDAQLSVTINPANDHLVNATPLSFGLSTIRTTNLGASRETNELSHFGNTNGTSRWWVLLPTSDQTFYARVSGTHPSHSLIIYRGIRAQNPRFSDLQLIGSTHHSAAPLLWDTKTNSPIFIAVNTRADFSGDYTFSIGPVSRSPELLQTYLSPRYDGRNSSSNLMDYEWQIESPSYPGLSYRLERSVNAQSWEPVVTRIAQERLIRFNIDHPTMSPHSLYRVLAIP